MRDRNASRNVVAGAGRQRIDVCRRRSRLCRCGIERHLVGRQYSTDGSSQNVLGAVAVMDVPVDDGDRSAYAAAAHGGRNRGIVEQAESSRSLGMVARWPCGDEHTSSVLEYIVDRRDGGSHRRQRRLPSGSSRYRRRRARCRSRGPLLQPLHSLPGERQARKQFHLRRLLAVECGEPFRIERARSRAAGPDVQDDRRGYAEMIGASRAASSYPDIGEASGLCQPAGLPEVFNRLRGCQGRRALRPAAERAERLVLRSRKISRLRRRRSNRDWAPGRDDLK